MEGCGHNLDVPDGASITDADAPVPSSASQPPTRSKARCRVNEAALEIRPNALPDEAIFALPDDLIVPRIVDEIMDETFAPESRR
jgi:hypothetical protein